MKQAKEKPALLNDMMKNAEPYMVSLDNGVTKQSTLGIKVDDRRLQNSFECIARALYYHEKKTKFSGNCIDVYPLFLFNQELQEERERIANIIDSSIASEEKRRKSRCVLLSILRRFKWRNLYQIGLLWQISVLYCDAIEWKT